MLGIVVIVLFMKLYKTFFNPSRSAGVPENDGVSTGGVSGIIIRFVVIVILYEAL